MLCGKEKFNQFWLTVIGFASTSLFIPDMFLPEIYNLNRSWNCILVDNLIIHNELNAWFIVFKHSQTLITFKWSIVCFSFSNTLDSKCCLDDDAGIFSNNVFDIIAFYWVNTVGLIGVILRFSHLTFEQALHHFFRFPEI